MKGTGPPWLDSQILILASLPCYLRRKDKNIPRFLSCPHTYLTSLDQISYWASAQTASDETQVFCYFVFCLSAGVEPRTPYSLDKHPNTEQLFPKSSSYFLFRGGLGKLPDWL